MSVDFRAKQGIVVDAVFHALPGVGIQLCAETVGDSSINALPSTRSHTNNDGNGGRPAAADSFMKPSTVSSRRRLPDSVVHAQNLFTPFTYYNITQKRQKDRLILLACVQKIKKKLQSCKTYHLVHVAARWLCGWALVAVVKCLHV